MVVECIVKYIQISQAFIVYLEGMALQDKKGGRQLFSSLIIGIYHRNTQKFFMKGSIP
jgi:hypothetical protein